MENGKKEIGIRIVVGYRRKMWDEDKNKEWRKEIEDGMVDRDGKTRWRGLGAV